MDRTASDSLSDSYERVAATDRHIRRATVSIRHLGVDSVISGSRRPRLTAALLSEAPSIFGWALTGLDRLNARGYFVPPESGATALQQLADLSSPTAAFVRDVCVVIPHATVPVEKLWAAWKQWCEAENRHPGTKSEFGKNLKAAVPTVERKRQRGEDREVHVHRHRIARRFAPEFLGPRATKASWSLVLAVPGPVH